MLIVDTSVWIDYLRGIRNAHTAILNQEIGRIDVGMTDLSLCEILQGARNNTIALQIQADLRMVHVLSTGGKELAISSAENYRRLRTLGFTVRNTVDCLIATFCIEQSHILLHRDRDFDLFERHLRLHVLGGTPQRPPTERAASRIR